MQDLLNRATGQLPVSIATSLAIESLLGIHPDIPVKTPPIEQYQELWINLRTLVRNILGSLESNARKNITPVEVKDILLEEMQYITNEVKSKGIREVVYYASDLNLSKYKYAKQRLIHTDRQRHEDMIIGKSIGLLLKQANDYPNDTYEVKRFSLSLKPTRNNTKTVIITHQCIDLLAYRSFKSLTLLESHTGAFKDRDRWYTKYYNGNELNQIPFTEKLLQVFGDKETFSPLDPKLRKAILEIAEKYRWTPLTTEDKINYGINSMRNQYAVDLYRQL